MVSSEVDEERQGNAMGATGWSYFVPYEADMLAALERLQAAVFESGAYERPALELEFLEEMEFFTVTAEEREELLSKYGLSPLRRLIAEVGLNGLRSRLETLAAAPELTNRADLEALQCLSSSGTHSILDMRGISTLREFGTVSPLTAARLRELYGTETPTHAQVTDSRHAIPEADERFYGVVFPVYDSSGTPTHLYFVGTSGD